MTPLSAEVPTAYYLVLAAILFSTGVGAFLIKRNVITVFMSIELMLNAGEEERTHGSRAAYLAGIPGAAAIFCLLSFVFLSERHNLGSVNIGGHLSHLTSNISELSTVLFTKLLLPFEVTSVLILVAILGAVVLARKEQ